VKNNIVDISYIYPGGLRTNNTYRITLTTKNGCSEAVYAINLTIVPAWWCGWNFKAGPNPAVSSVVLQYEAPDKENVDVFLTRAGTKQVAKTVQNAQTIEKGQAVQNTISVAELPSGLYQLNVKTGKGLWSKLIEVIH
jgi:hypothetical protein